MSYVKDFIDFMNNDMTEFEEQRFAENLASDREYLTNFKNYLIVTSTIKRNIQAFAMPVEVKQEIFRKLGLTLPNTAANPAAPERKEIKPKKSFWKRNFFTGFGSGITLSAFAFVFFIHQYPAHTEKNAPIDKSIPVIVSRPEGRHVIKNPLHKTKNTINRNSAYLQANDINTSNEPASSISPLNFAEFNLNNRQSVSASPIELNKLGASETQPVNPAINNNRSNISIGVANTASWNIPQPTIPLGNILPFNNLSISIYYHINDKLKIGVEGRQENYFLEYYGTESDSTLFKYSQSSNFTTFGLKAAYQPAEFHGIKPTVQLCTGINQGGIAIRPYLGLEYQPYQDISLNLGVEYTRYWYAHQSAVGSTSKIAFVYGLIVKL